MDAKQLVEDGIELVSLPDVYLQVKAVIEDTRSGAADLARAIETDPALCARLLGMANSPFFGFATQIGSVSRAVSVLGTVQVHDLVLATSLGQTFSGVDCEVLDVATFWRDSVRRGVGAKVLAGHCNLLDAERVFLAGLLCHIGEMVMALRTPEALQTTSLAALERGQSLVSVQREMLGFDYAEVGAELFQAWHLPGSLEATVRLHTEPRQATDFALETAIVHVAAILTGPDSSRLDDSALGLMNLNADTLARVPAEIERAAAEVLSLLYPPARKTA